MLLGITANHNTQGLKATALSRAARVFSTKKTRAAPSLETSFVLDLCREMPPPSETQKTAGYQNQGGIKQSSWALNKKNETANGKITKVIAIITQDEGKTSLLAKIWAPVNTLSRFTGQGDNNHTFL